MRKIPATDRACEYTTGRNPGRVLVEIWAVGELGRINAAVGERRKPAEVAANEASAGWMIISLAGPGSTETLEARTVVASGNEAC